MPTSRSSQQARLPRTTILACLMLLATDMATLHAQQYRLLWQAQGLAVGDTTGAQRNPQLAPDGAGGAIVVWEDLRMGVDAGVYASKLLKDGGLPWQSAGVRVAAPGTSLALGGILEDGHGGVFITWSAMAGPNLDILAQRLDIDGLPQWGVDGITVTSAARDQRAPVVASDGTGGIIVAWEDTRSGTSDIRAQRIDPMGRALWSTDGTPVCSAAGNQIAPRIASDGNGGAFVAWTDLATDADILMQRLRSDGTRAWGEDLAVAVFEGRQHSPALTAHAPGSAAVVWLDDRGGRSAVTIQIVDMTAGETFLDGLRLAVSPLAQEGLVVTGDGLGGVLSAWSSRSSDSTAADVYMGRVRSDGSVPGSATQLGEAVCALTGSAQFDVQMLPDGAGGAFAVWQDARPGAGHDIYMSRIASSGSTTLNGWPLNGIKLAGALGKQFAPRMLASSPGSAIVVWLDERAGTGHPTIFAQRVDWCPVLTATTDTLHFGARRVRETALDSVIVRNTGALPLVVTNVRRTVTGNAFQDYEVRLSFPLPCTVPPDSMLTVHVACTPGAAGPRQGVLRINSNAPVDPFDLPLITEGAEARITVPALLVLGPVRVGGMRDTVVTDLISNTGDVDMTITRIDIEGEHAAEFTLPALALPLVLQPGRSVDLRLRAAPAGEGGRNAVLRFASNADDTLKSMAVSVAGGVPRLRTAPLAMHFDPVTIGGAQTLQLAIENSGLVDLEVRGTRIEGGNADQFRLGTLTLGFVVPGESMKVTVTFLPTLVGVQRSTLFVDSDDPSSPASLLIDGNGLMVGLTQPPTIPAAPVLTAYPSPYRASAGAPLTLRVMIERPGSTSIEIVDPAGRIRAHLTVTFSTSGLQTISLPVSRLAPLPPGLYILRLAGTPATAPIILLR